MSAMSKIISNIKHPPFVLLTCSRFCGILTGEGGFPPPSYSSSFSTMSATALIRFRIAVAKTIRCKRLSWLPFFFTRAIRFTPFRGGFYRLLTLLIIHALRVSVKHYFILFKIIFQRKSPLGEFPGGLFALAIYCRGELVQKVLAPAVGGEIIHCAVCEPGSFLHDLTACSRFRNKRPVRSTVAEDQRGSPRIGFPTDHTAVGNNTGRGRCVAFDRVNGCSVYTLHNSCVMARFSVSCKKYLIPRRR